MDLESAVRRRVYDITIRRGYPPTIAELSAELSVAEPETRRALKCLAVGRVLVLQPVSGEILMAPPFSAVPTPFVVETSRHSSYANCAWDGLGVAVMLRERARIVTSCGCCGEAIAVEVDPANPPPHSYVVHFAVPAARWWHDIVFT